MQEDLSKTDQSPNLSDTSVPETDTPKQPIQSPLPTPPKISNKKLLVGTVAVLIFALLGTTGFFAYKYFQSQKQEVATEQQIADETSPSPTPDPTADWQTYENEEFGFKLSYPPIWKVQTGTYNDFEKDTAPCVSYNFVRFTPLKHEINYLTFGRLTIDVIDNEGLSIQKLFNKYHCDAWNPNYKLGDEIINSASTVELGKTSSLKLRRFNDGDFPFGETWRVHWYIIEHKNKVLRLWTMSNVEVDIHEDAVNEDLFNQILSTFEFVDNGGSTAGWKNLSNSRLKFSLKYPENYYFETVARDDGFGFSYLLGPSKDEVFKITVRDNYSSPQAEFFLDTSSTGNLEINGTTWKTYYLPNGYGDGQFIIGADQPVYGLQLEKNGVLYSLSFYKQSSLTSVQNQVLSTFEFIE